MTWNVEDSGGLYCGIWRATLGKWRVSNDEWEYFHILSGESILTDAEGVEHRLVADDSMISARVSQKFAKSLRRRVRIM